MADAVTDTHALIWYLQDDRRLGQEARSVYDSCDRGDSVVYVPTICLVEIVYLHEKGNIPAHLKSQLEAELKAGTSGLVLADLTIEVVDALEKVSRDNVPDMPDRIIAATAISLGLPLMSRDRKIRVSGVNTIW